MSYFEDKSITIYEAMQNIKNQKYVMPAFQREFVWSLEQIEKLWDSILIDYPFANFLFWHLSNENVTYDTYICSFLQKATFNSRKQSDDIHYPTNGVNVRISDTAILDGQQRLTSLFLSLYGDTNLRPRFSRKSTGGVTILKLFIELDKNKAIIDDEEYEGKNFDISFSYKVPSGTDSFTKFEIKNIMNEKFKNLQTRDKAIEEFVKNVPENSKDYAKNILNKLCSKIYEEKLIRYTEIFEMDQTDALEMFIRFNNGGKKLRKHEITMSILEMYWSEAMKEFHMLLGNDYEGFSIDLIIRTALMFYGDVTKTIINQSVANSLKDNWSRIKITFDKLKEVFNKLNISLSRFINDYTKLVPLLYHIYHNPYDIDNDLDIFRVYLTRTIFLIYFRSGTPGKLNKLKALIDNNGYRMSIDMFNAMPELSLTEGKIDDILNCEKGSRLAGEVLYFISRDYLTENAEYDQDHLYPESVFSNFAPYGISIDVWREWKIKANRLPNLQLLTSYENKQKSNRSFRSYVESMSTEQREKFYKSSLIPKGIVLEISEFESFYNQRKELLKQKIIELMN